MCQQSALVSLQTPSSKVHGVLQRLPCEEKRKMGQSDLFAPISRQWRSAELKDVLPYLNGLLKH